MAKKEYKVRRVRDEEDRRTGSADYLTMEEGEKFLGYALFEGDPKEDEPGYFEFIEHWNQAARRSIPCAGDDCIYCEDGDRPRNRAKSLWFVVKDNKGSEVNKVMTFNLNSKLIKLVTELRGEGDKIKGQLFRVSLLDDRGSYSLVPKAGKALPAKEIKEHLKDAPDWEAILTAALKKAMEGVAVARAMDDDDDDPDDEETPAAKKSGKGKGKEKDTEPEPDEDQEWPDDGLDEVEVTVAKVEKEGNWIEVTADGYEDSIKVWTTEGIEFDLSSLDKGDEVTISTGEKDSDGEYVLSAEPETGGGDDPAADDPDESELPDAIEGDVFEIVSMDASESIMDVKNDELEFTLYFIDTVPVDFDDYEEGDKIVVTAEKDTSGDLVATEVPTKKKTGKGGKGGKKKGK